MSVIVKGGGGENVTPEVTAQTPMISQILSNLGFTADSAIGTNKQKLQTNNANLGKIEDYLPHGQYVWKKLTAQGGDFVDFVVSDIETAYPDGAVHTDGYWYEKSGGNTPDNGIFINSLDSNGYPTDILIKSDSQVAPSFLTSAGWSKLSNIVVDTVSIGSYFITALQNLTGKLKLKNVTTIGEFAFQNIGKNTGASAKVFIPNTCTTIAASGMTNAPFYNNANDSSKKINIYCEATSKPDGWGTYWNLASGGYGNHNVLWGVSESEFDAL